MLWIVSRRFLYCRLLIDQFGAAVHEGSSTVCVEASKGVDNDMEKEYFLRNKEDCLDGVRYHNNVLVERFDTLKDNFVGDGSNDESNQFSQEKFLSAQDCHGRR